MCRRSFQFQLLPAYIVVLLSMRMVVIGVDSGVRDAGIHCVERERRALLMFKRELIDEDDILSSWATDEENKNCCNWMGVHCSNRTGHVIRLNLGSNSLGGNISSSLLGLQHLYHLDLSENYFGWYTPVPDFIGSLSNLRYLNLSFSFFSGTLPYQLGNLSNLHALDLSWNYDMYFSNLEWLSHLPHLEYLDMRDVNLSSAIDWQQATNGLSFLTHLYLGGCGLSQIVPPSPHQVNHSSSLLVLDLSENNLNSSIYQWVFNFSSNLVQVDLSSNNLQGPIPEAFGRLCGLKSLLLYMNELSQKLSGLFETLLGGCGGHLFEILD
ncbi:receptor-like protein EIX1 [Malania oleifera]|uniref:receptor-like protein EIX1 n=1 Tax=Malania oleifera TaxID=397392 RepID=UPI0025AE35F0|nr:receptor-like protein EIX1 [Malania oleifera]